MAATGALMFSPLIRAFAQIDDPVFVGVVLRSVTLSVLAFIGLFVACSWGMEAIIGHQGWLGWLAGLTGAAGAALLALWLFVPVAVLIATLFLGNVAAAVEQRFYPGKATYAATPAAIQIWDGIVLGAQVLILQGLAIVLSFLLPGVGMLLGWGITGWAIGRGFFVAVAMRHMSRNSALSLYGKRRIPVLLQGGMLAFASSLPVVNLLVPVLGVAMLTHVLNQGAGPR